MVALSGLCPDREWARVGWGIWVWLIVMLVKIPQVGGIIGGVTTLLSIAFPSVPVVAWLIPLVIDTAALVSRGYAMIERTRIVLTSVFTVSTLASLLALQGTDLAHLTSLLWKGKIRCSTASPTE